MKTTDELQQEAARTERGDALLSDVIAQLKQIVSSINDAQAVGGRQIGAYVELNEVKNLVGNWLIARAARLNNAAEVRRAATK